MSAHEEYIEAMLETLADATDDECVSVLSQLLHTRDEAMNYDAEYTRLLYQPPILMRLARIRREDPALFYSRFATAIRRRRDLSYAEIIAAIDAHVRVYDPYAFTPGPALLAQPVQPVRWLVPGLIAEGLTILGGTPKSGKSYLAYTLAMATAVYGHWLQHWEVATGPVIFISLEDDPDDTRLRLAELDPDLHLRPGQIEFLHGFDKVPSFDEGLVSWLLEAMEQYHPRLVVIDPLSYLYTTPKRGQNDLFTETRHMLFPLRWLAKSHRCAIVALDHRRKRSRDDTNVFDTLHGSIAKQAIADTLLMVEREREDVLLNALVRRGVDATYTLTMQFRDGRCWITYTGETLPKTAISSYGEYRQKVYTALMTYQQPMTVTEILAIAEIPDTRQTRSQLYNVLIRAQKDGDITKKERGTYLWAPKA